MIARELRELVMTEHGLTCSAGVSYNKLLAKVGVTKPDIQTVVGAGGVVAVGEASCWGGWIGWPGIWERCCRGRGWGG